MNVAQLAARQGRAILLLVVLVAFAGILALGELPSSIYPPLQFPRLVVVAHSGTLPGRSMMLAVARPLEQAAMEVPGIRRVRSKSFRGATEVSAQFEASTNMDLALQQLQNHIAEVRSSMPSDLDLAVERLTPASFPMYSLILSGNLATPELRDYAYYVMRPALARVPGVGRVDVLASDSREIEVIADPARLLAAGLTVNDLAAALGATNELVPVGRYTTGGRTHLVLASGLWKDLEEIRATPIAVRKGATLRVADLAMVAPGSPDRTLLTAGNGQPAALLSLSQQVGANVVSVEQGIEEAVRTEIAPSLPSGLHIAKVYDLAQFVSTAIDNVRDAILLGGFLAVLVLLVFLGDWKMTVISALTLPLTVLATFVAMRWLGESINLMSMGGLAVAIGLVIDDAVVVVENIHRRRAAGRGELAVEEAIHELVAPVVGSTLTTVVVLAPLGLLSGVVGQFFRALSLTLSAAVLISLVLSLTLIPLLAQRAGRHETEARRAPRWATRLDAFYARTLAGSLRRPLWAVLAVVTLAVGAVLLGMGVPSGFLPAMDEGGFVIDCLSPPGTALELTGQAMHKIEELLRATPEVASFSRRTGAELGIFATEQNKGDILVRLKPRSQRSRSADEIIDDLRPRCQKAAPTLDIEFAQLLQDMLGDLEGTPTPIEIKVFGDDPEILADLAEKVQDMLGKVQGVVDLVGPERGNPELTWEIDPGAAGRIGLTVEQVATQISAAWLGTSPTELRLLDRTVPVRVRFPDSERHDPAELASLTIRGANGALAPLSALGQAVPSDSQSVLTRENLRQMAPVTARLEKRDLGSAVSEIRRGLRAIKLPIGYSFEVGGQYESQRQAFRELLTVFGIAASLVLIVLVVEFRAFTPAILLLAAAPLSLGGAFGLLWATGSELNVSSAMGLILLVGLVVKNGIVMLDYAHRLRAEGTPFTEAVAAAAQVRLRPIVMTTLCTLFGLLPLALGLGAGAELQKPLALAVIGGLGLSTLVTLYAVPSLYVAILRKRPSVEASEPEPAAP
jgi:CzcA family heavy metal efflux pump